MSMKCFVGFCKCDYEATFVIKTAIVATKKVMVWGFLWVILVA